MTVDDFDEELRNLGKYLPAEDPEQENAVYGLAEVSIERRDNLERLGQALEQDEFQKAQELYEQDEKLSSEYRDNFRQMNNLMMEENVEAIVAANKVGMALQEEYYDALQNANIAQEGGSSGLVETVLEKGSI